MLSNTNIARSSGSINPQKTLKDFPAELVHEVGLNLLPPPFTPEVRDAFLSGMDMGLVLSHYFRCISSLGSLSSLSRVCRAIRGVIEPLLYRRLIVSLTDYSPPTMWCEAYQQALTDVKLARIPKIHLLLRTLVRRPDLACHVTAVQVDSGYLVLRAAAMGNLNYFLSLCPRVHTLILKTDYLDDLDPRNLPSLTTLATRNAASEAIDETCSRFPQLTSFEVYCYQTTFPVSRRPPATLPPKLKSLCVSFDPVVFEHSPEDLFLWVIKRFGHKAMDLCFRCSTIRMLSHPTLLPSLKVPTERTLGTALRNLQLKHSHFLPAHPHTHDVLRHLPHLEHLHISFCQPLKEEDILDRLPRSLRYLTFSLYGQIVPDLMYRYAFRLENCPSLDEGGFVRSLVRCLSKTFEVGRSGSVPHICGVVVLRGSRCKCHPNLDVADFRPLEEFCGSHEEVAFYEELQSVFPENLEAGRGIIQVILVPRRVA